MRFRLLALVPLLVLPGCAGGSCGDLPALTAARDQARQEQLELIRSGTATGDEIAERDDELHAIERRVAELEAACE